MSESSRRFRTALVGATLLGVVDTTAQAAAPPTPIAEIGPVNMISETYNGQRTFWTQHYAEMPFTITTAGMYYFVYGWGQFENLSNGYGELLFSTKKRPANEHIFYDYFSTSGSFPAGSFLTFLSAGDYLLWIYANGQDYEAFGVYASVTPVTAVPGPIAGAGLPLLLGFAGYAAWRRRAAKAAA